MPPGGLNIRHDDRLHRPGSAAARLQARRRCAPSSAPTASTASSIPAAARPKIGIITVGKSYLDVRQALEDIGIDEAKAQPARRRASSRSAARGRSTFEHIKDFARGLEMIVVVEEKRSLIEVQVREDLYGTAHAADRASARRTSAAHWLFPAKGALDPNDIAIALGERVPAVIGPSRRSRRASAG